MHRDLKPANILIHFTDIAEGEEIKDTAEYCKAFDFKHNHQSMVVKIADLGLAKIVVGDDKARTFCGSPSFMAPELFDHFYYDHSADTWSLGVIYYYMLVGVVPFSVESK